MPLVLLPALVQPHIAFGARTKRTSPPWQSQCVGADHDRDVVRGRIRAPAPIPPRPASALAIHREALERPVSPLRRPGSSLSLRRSPSRTSCASSFVESTPSNADQCLRSPTNGADARGDQNRRCFRDLMQYKRVAFDRIATLRFTAKRIVESGQQVDAVSKAATAMYACTNPTR